MDDALEYINSLRLSVSRLVNDSIKLKEANKYTVSNYDRTQNLVNEELSDLNNELISLEKDTSLMVKEVLFVLSKFKQLGLKPHLNIVEEKLETWQPNNLITRKEFISLLEREL